MQMIEIKNQQQKSRLKISLNIQRELLQVES
jgi:hypothetical protein